MKKRRIFILAIANIALLAGLVSWIYPEVPPAALATVIAISGLALAIAVDLVLRRFFDERP